MFYLIFKIKKPQHWRIAGTLHNLSQIRKILKDNFTNRTAKFLAFVVRWIVSYQYDIFSFFVPFGELTEDKLIFWGALQLLQN